MTYTTTGEGLFAAIIDNPDDDGLRLIYADWLEENEQEDRARFIRLQITAYAEDNAFCGIDGKRSAVHERWARDVCEWTGGMEYAHKRVIFRRGWVDEVRLCLALWSVNGPQIITKHPLIRTVKLIDAESVSSTGSIAWAKSKAAEGLEYAD